MKPFLVLLVSFVIALLATKIFNHHWNVIFAGNAAMSVMLLFTASGHFAFPKGMSMMIPQFIPFKTALVYLTGLVEIAGAIGLLMPGIRWITSLLLIIFFILILPANIYAALQRVDYQKGTKEGNGPKYLWFRIPLQLFFIAWVYYFGT